MRSFAPRPIGHSLRTAPLPRAGGFTLLEILVVVVIVAILATFAVLSVGSRALEDRLDLEARRLKELIALAADEAVLQGAEVGFFQTPDGYAFLVLKDGAWVPADDTGALRGRALRPPLFLQLWVEGRPVAPAASTGEEKPSEPQVLLLSSGEATEFRLELRAAGFGPYFALDGDALGRLTLERKEPS